jgi:hypothetical protein
MVCEMNGLCCVCWRKNSWCAHQLHPFILFYFFGINILYCDRKEYMYCALARVIRGVGQEPEAHFTQTD